MPALGIRTATVAVTTAAAVALGGAAALANTAGTAYSVGSYHHVGQDWSVKVVSSDRNANAEVAQANMFNEKPKAGYQYVSVLFRAKKATAGEGNAFWDLGYHLYGRSTHHLYSSADGGFLNNDILNADSVLKGGVTTGTTVFEVKKTDITAGGLRFVADDPMSFSGAKSWYRVS